MGSGFHHERFSTKNRLPTQSDSYNIRIQFNDTDGVKLFKEYSDYKKKEISTDELESEIRQTLRNLGTRNKCEKEFPEAFKLLPKVITKAVVLNIDSLRDRIKTA